LRVQRLYAETQDAAGDVAAVPKTKD
jgi:hypothetical protein